MPFLIPFMIASTIIGGSAVAWHAVDKVTAPENLNTVANKGSDTIIVLGLIAAGTLVFLNAGDKKTS